MAKLKIKRRTPKKPRGTWNINPVTKIHDKSGYDRSSSRRILQHEVMDNNVQVH